MKPVHTASVPVGQLGSEQRLLLAKDLASQGV
jgi:hypothetical protein